MESDNAFNILALDGGGIRGVYGAYVLARLEDTLSAPVRERFDLIAGTSTGVDPGGRGIDEHPHGDSGRPVRESSQPHLQQEEVQPLPLHTEPLLNAPP